jgi:hypothetical protein
MDKRVVLFLSVDVPALLRFSEDPMELLFFSFLFKVFSVVLSHSLHSVLMCVC